MKNEWRLKLVIVPRLAVRAKAVSLVVLRRVAVRPGRCEWPRRGECRPQRRRRRVAFLGSYGENRGGEHKEEPEERCS